jgi:hypothetical protein
VTEDSNEDSGLQEEQTESETVDEDVQYTSDVSVPADSDENSGGGGGGI